MWKKKCTFAKNQFLMSRALFFVLTIFGLSFSSFADVDPYVVDDKAIDQTFEQAVEVDITDMSITPFNDLGTPTASGFTTQLNSDNAWAAWAICFVVGGFGLHRHYMGTSKWMWAYYTFTCGGIFGIVTFVDWVVLLVGAIHNDIGQYLNNNEFFMWK